MGVKDLWKILECAGHPVTLESLEGLVVAVDVSIWLNQAVKGARDRQGEMLKGAHLAVLFSRICKLLHYRIKPVFVFDGPPPTLKSQTLRSRNQRRRANSQKLLKNADKRLSKYLQASILSQMTGEKDPLSLRHPAKPPTNDDLFWLPPLPDRSGEHFLQEDRPTSSRGDVDGGDHGDGEPASDLYHEELADLDVHSEQFSSLPPETQHDLLLEKQRYEKYTYHHPSTLPQVADDFSQYQLARLVKRSRVSEKLECVRRVLKSGEAAVAVGDVTKVHHVESDRVVSSDHTHYILVKGSGLESSLDNNDTGSDLRKGEPPELDRNKGMELRDSPMELRDSPMDVVHGSVPPDSSERTQLLTQAAGCNSKYSPPATNDMISHVSGTADPFVPCSGTGTRTAGSLVLATSTDFLIVPTIAVGTVTTVHTASSADGSFNEAMESMATPLGHLSIALTTHSGIRDVGQDEKDVLPGGSGEGGTFSNSDGAPPLKETGDRSKDGAPPLKETGDRSKDRAPPLKETADRFKDLLDREGPTTPHSYKAAVNSSPPFISSSEEEALEDEGVVVGVVNVEETKMSGVEETQTSGVETKTSGVEETKTSGVVIDENDRACKEGISPHRADKGISPHATADIAGMEMESLLEMPLGVAREQVRGEVKVLEEERNRERRDEAVVESHMYQDARELLSLFGLPYILSPGEAEAQCATLELFDLTNGTITDDNDVLLFGGSTVYRHFFSQDHHPEKYTMEEINGQLGLSREKLILLAYLLGSDYTDGLEGIGTVLAAEFLDEFKLDSFSSLQAFKEWHSNIPLGVNQTTPLKRKLSQLVLPLGFPNEAVMDAYLHPRVDQSKETFSWSKPDLDLIRKFAASHIGWTSAKVDGILLPVIKKMNAPPESQQKMTRFIVSLHPSPGKKMATMSKRMRKAVDKLRTSEACRSDTFKGLSSSGSDSDEGSSSQAKRPRGKEKDKPVSQVPTQKPPAPVQGLESADNSDPEFESLAREIIQSEHGVAGADECGTEAMPSCSQGRGARGKKGRGRKTRGRRGRRGQMTL